MWIAEVIDMSAGFRRRAAGVPLERLHVSGICSQTDVKLSAPCKGTEILKITLDFAEREMALVSSPQEGVVHLRTGVAYREIQRNLAIRPQQFAIAHNQVIDGQREELLDRSILSTPPLFPGGGNIGRAVRGDGDVNHRMIERQRVKAKLGSQKRDYL